MAGLREVTGDLIFISEGVFGNIFKAMLDQSLMYVGYSLFHHVLSRIIPHGCRAVAYLSADVVAASASSSISKPNSTNTPVWLEQPVSHRNGLFFINRYRPPFTVRSRWPRWSSKSSASKLAQLTSCHKWDIRRNLKIKSVPAITKG